jgi:hypothetical protein
VGDTLTQPIGDKAGAGANFEHAGAEFVVADDRGRTVDWRAFAQRSERQYQRW